MSERTLTEEGREPLREKLRGVVYYNVRAVDSERRKVFFKI